MLYTIDAFAYTYYIQLFCIHYVIIVCDGAYIASSITAIIPWLLIFTASWRKGYYFSHNFKNNILPFKCGNNKFCVIILLLFILIILFGALSSIFDFNDSGFWSIYGSSQIFGSIILISYIFQSLWCFWIASKIQYLDDNETKEYQQIATNEENIELQKN